MPITLGSSTPADPNKFASPDITPAQIGAIITFAASQAVAWGWITNSAGQKFVAVGGILIAAAWKIADSIVRHGRATGSADRSHAAPLAP